MYCSESSILCIAHSRSSRSALHWTFVSEEYSSSGRLLSLSIDFWRVEIQRLKHLWISTRKKSMERERSRGLEAYSSETNVQCKADREDLEWAMQSIDDFEQYTRKHKMLLSSKSCLVLLRMEFTILQIASRLALSSSSSSLISSVYFGRFVRWFLNFWGAPATFFTFSSKIWSNLSIFLFCHCFRKQLRGEMGAAQKLAAIRHLVTCRRIQVTSTRYAHDHWRQECKTVTELWGNMVVVRSTTTVSALLTFI